MEWHIWQAQPIPTARTAWSSNRVHASPVEEVQPVASASAGGLPTVDPPASVGEESISEVSMDQPQQEQVGLDLKDNGTTAVKEPAKL